MRAGTSRWGSTAFAGGTYVLAKSQRLTTAPSFSSQRKAVKSVIEAPRHSQPEGMIARRIA
jgi:hypothetical protein